MYSHRGFTLIELMVTISVAAIIMAIAVPSMRLMQANARMASTANDLASDLKKTRSNAITYRTNYTFFANNSSSWGDGWKATFNANDNAAASSAPKSNTLLHKVGLSAGVTVTQSATTFLFNGTTGRVSDADGVPLDIVFVICDNKVSDESGYNVALNRFGRVLIQRHTSATTCSI